MRVFDPGARHDVIHPYLLDLLQRVALPASFKTREGSLWRVLLNCFLRGDGDKLGAGSARTVSAKPYAYGEIPPRRRSRF